MGLHERLRDKRDMQHVWGRKETYENIRHRVADIHTDFLKFLLQFIIHLRAFVSKCKNNAGNKQYQM
jgi:hypothetical protein